MEGEKEEIFSASRLKDCDESLLSSSSARVLCLSPPAS
jgi:hypothetical protein